MDRREFVSRAALLSGAAALGCRETDPIVQEEPSSLEHVIVVTMENRSFDHLLGWHPTADGRQAGLTYADGDGDTRSTHRLTQLHGCDYADPNNSWEGARVSWNGGQCDGWLRVPGNDDHAIGYYAQSDLQFLGQLAPGWTVLDRYFSPIMAPTLPNRAILLAGQADRIDNRLVVSTLPTIWDRLAARNVNGRAYGAFTTTHMWGLKYSSLIRPLAQFHSDAAAGLLPAVSFVEPDLSDDFGSNYHPPDDIRNGEAFLSAVYRSVTTGPSWKSSLLVITFDEWGGFFDHVPPPPSPVPALERNAGNSDGLRGFRVPAVLVSPFVRRGYVSSRVYDHASVLRLIETRWGLDPLTDRDANANDLGAELDFASPDPTAGSLEVPAGPFVPPCR